MVTKKEVLRRIKAGEWDDNLLVVDGDMIASYYPDGLKWDGRGIEIKADGEFFWLVPKEAIKVPLSRFRLIRADESG